MPSAVGTPAPDRPTDPPYPARIGPYRIVGRLGAGGMGLVYRGEHVETGENVALKTPRVANRNELASLRREVHALTRLRHPAVVRFVAEGVEGGRPWYAMELLEGATLAERMRPGSGSLSSESRSGADTPTQSKLLPASESGLESAAADRGEPETRRTLDPSLGDRLELIRRLCAPLAFIHGEGIVHRDLKPSNVLVRSDGTPVLTDFGLVSRFLSGGGREVLEATGEARGTPAYMAPEQLRGESIDARVDLYSLGCILYEVVVGRPPFGGSTTNVVLQQASAAPRRPSEIVEAVPPALEELILRLLAKDRRQRIGYADDVAAALAELGAERKESAPGPRPRSYLYRPGMVGRGEARARLEEMILSAVGGRGRFALMVGESGVGKTFLASATTAAARSRGMRVVVAECAATSEEEGSSHPRAAPLQPLRPLLQALADYCTERGTEATERLLGASARVLAAHEPALAQVPGADAYAAPSELPPEAELERLLAILAETLSRFAAEGPLLLVLDDLHWADDLTVKFLVSLLPGFCEQRPLLILGTCRAEEMPAWLKAASENGDTEVVSLGRFDDDSVSAMVGDMLALPEPPAYLVSSLSRHSAGNPFFVAEFLRAAVSEGLLFRESGGWRVTAPADGTGGAYDLLPLPPNLRELVARRLDGLTAGARGVAEAAAVLRGELSTDLLLEIAGLAEDHGFTALAELVERQVLEPLPDARLGFVHHKVREGAYDRMAPERRRGLHHAAASSLEARHRGGADFALQFAELAYHWKRAGDAAKALEYFERAGDHAMSTSAYADAIRLFGDALETASPGALDGLRQARWERQIGEAWIGMDDHGESRRHLARAVALLGWPLPEGRLRRTFAFLGEIVQQAWRRLVPHRPDRRAPSSPRVLEAARAYAHLFVALRYAAGPDQVLFAALRSLNLAERGGTWPLLAMSYSLMQQVAAAARLRRLAERYGQLTREALEHTDDRNARSWALMAMSVHRMSLGDWRHARELASESARIAEEIGYRRRWEDAAVCLAAAELSLGHVEDALKLYRRIEESARRGAHRHRAWALGGLTVIAIRQGHVAQAAASAEQGETLLAAPHDPMDGLRIHAATALVRLHRGDLAGAWKAASEAAEVLFTVPPVMVEMIGEVSMVSEALIELLRRSDAFPEHERPAIARAAQRSCAHALAFMRAFPLVRGDALYFQGEFEWLRGRRARARRLWAENLAAAQAFGMPYHEARVRLALARDAAVDLAASHTATAHEILHRIGVKLPTMTDSREVRR